MEQHRGRPVIYGEVLFDRFEDGTAVLGGAPFNVAWHLQGLGLSPVFISRVGQDADGEHILRTMAAWGMDTRGVQVDPQRPTGAVRITLQDGQPTFDILPEQAYDYIDTQGVREALAGETCALLYHGTLITRAAVSRSTLFGAARTADRPVFVDVNLRPPWWDLDTLHQALNGARWAKLNEHELAAALARETLAPDAIEEAAHSLSTRAGLELLVVTMGEAGACVVDDNGMACGEPVPVTELMDTVGAGDAFSAVSILGLLQGWSHERILARALGFASAVCAIRGATTTDVGLYRDQQQQWQHDDA